MRDNQQPPQDSVQPFACETTLVFLGGPTFDISDAHAAFGMVTGFRGSVPGRTNCLEIRRVLTRAPRMKEQLAAYTEKRSRTAQTGLSGALNARAFGVGINFRDEGGWGLGLYYESCEVVDTYVEMSGNLPIVEDVLILCFEREANITERLQTRVHLAVPGEVPPPPGKLHLVHKR